MPKLLRAKALIGLWGVALFVFLAARTGLVAGESVTNRAISIEEIRQRMQNAKTHYQGSDPQAFDRAIDSAVAELRTRYGEQIPAVEAIKFLREFPFPLGDTSAAPHESGSRAVTTAPEGVQVERTPVGFLLRARSRSLAGGLVGIGFAVLLCAIPFIVFGDLIRSIWQAEGLSFWLGSAFLAAWACGAVYAMALGCMTAFGEVRITKEGNGGEIFTGIGTAGRTHRVEWSDFQGAGDRAVATVSNNRFGHIKHYVGLDGASRSYKFGSDLNDEQRAFVIAFLRENVFGTAATRQ